MNEKMEAVRRRYEDVPIPAELNARVNLEVQRSRRKHRQRRRWTQAVASLAGCAAAFVLMVNGSPTFAQALEPVPVLGDLVRIITGQAYQVENEETYLDIRTPVLQNTGNSELEKRINAEIQSRVDAMVAEAKERGREQYEAWLATRTSEEDYFMPVIVEVSYDVKCSNDRVLSFVLYKTETRASAYTESYVYNIDLQTGEAITLEDILGPNWMEIANETVKAGIAQRSQEPGNVYYTMEEYGMEFEGISENQRFYINEAGNPVILFDKYEIAPGYMGAQEFEIDRNAASGNAPKGAE